MAWYKGNLHCHSSRSDGKATPEHVAKFYKFLGYDFLGLSDHDRLTPIKEWAEPAGILGIPSCEYSGEICCHVVSTGVKVAVGPSRKKYYSKNPRSNVKILQDGVDRTLKAGGIPIICHPAWNWTLDYDAISKIKGCRHFEICNASPDCNSFPIPGYEPMDNLWDKLLSSGHRYFAVASDDAHEYYNPHDNRSPSAALGFIVVEAKSLTLRNILDSIRKGRFYASTGVMLENYKVTKKGIEIGITQICRERTVFQFFGANGEELKRCFGTEGSYRFTGKELYVRTRIASTAGVWAWTQPVFLEDNA